MRRIVSWFAGFVVAFGPVLTLAQSPDLNLPTVQAGIPDGLLAPPPTLPAVATGAVPEPKVFALVMGHARDASIGAGIQVSAARLENLLEQAYQSGGLELTFVGFPRNGRGPEGADGGAFTHTAIEQAIATVNAKVTSIDTVACFVLAHGAFDNNRYTAEYEYGHYFGTEGNGYYPRSTLVERLKSKSPKLTVLLSDSCNVRSDMPPSNIGPAPATVAAVQRLESLKSLLSNHHGVVSINASSPGQFSFYDPTQGGYFIQAFENSLKSCRADVGWNEFFSIVSAETNNVFLAGFAPYGGCPYAWEPISRRVLTLSPSDPRTQKVLQPFASRSLRLVAQDGVDVVNAPKLCPCAPDAATAPPPPTAEPAPEPTAADEPDAEKK